MEGIEQVLPRVRDARIIGATVGARPPLYAWGKMEDALSREHEVVGPRAHGAKALLLIGGKLASYRMFRPGGRGPDRPEAGQPRRVHDALVAAAWRRPASDIDLARARFA
ncbi:MAG: hypothetical protein IPF99_27020 [Deltaproteobacteria bacterium]|nr:hypothetical protein [Deltaproteobacteria bacterium]